MNSLKHLIGDKKRRLLTANGGTEKTWQKNSELSSVLTDDPEFSHENPNVHQTLQDLAEFYSRERISEKMAKSKRHRSEEELSQKVTTEEKFLTERLAELGLPLKEFGETLEDRRLRLYEHERRQKTLRQEFTEVVNIPLSLPPATKVLLFIEICLTKWKQELDQRPSHQQQTPEGKKALEMFFATTKDLQPLQKRLQHPDQVEVLDKLGAIVDFCVKQEFVRAHDKYLDLAIGNAAWPMGVTMVGIHERVGRSKIAASEIAHILNDETTRKYIQMIKRLMTLCQTWYPTDPSRMVNIASTHLK